MVFKQIIRSWDERKDDMTYKETILFLQGYAEQKRKLRRLQRMREEYSFLRASGNNLGTAVQTGHNSDTTGDTATRLITTIDRLDDKIAVCAEKLSAVTNFIEKSKISETDKLILTDVYICGLKYNDVYADIGEQSKGSATMRKRVHRIIEKTCI